MVGGGSCLGRWKEKEERKARMSCRNEGKNGSYTGMGREGKGNSGGGVLEWGKVNELLIGQGKGR